MEIFPFNKLYILLGYKEIKESIENGTKSKRINGNNHSLKKNIKRTNFEIEIYSFITELAGVVKMNEDLEGNRLLLRKL